MAERMKGFTCCGDCIHYNWKKHRCTLGASIETNAKDHFYDDCPLPDVVEGKVEEIRAKAIDEFAEECKKRVAQGELYDYVRWCNWNNSVDKWFDRIAEQLKGGAE